MQTKKEYNWPAMNAEAKKVWLKALRSGEYQQCRGSLHRSKGVEDPGSFCCLGVLTHEWGDGEWVYPNDTHLKNPAWSYKDQYSMTFSVLPNSVQVACALSSDSTLNTLMRLNDEGKSFKEIADIIEREL